MKSEKEIKDRIEDIYNAMVDLDNACNYKEAEKLAVKIQTLNWVLGRGEELKKGKEDV